MYARDDIHFINLKDEGNNRENPCTSLLEELQDIR